MSIVRDLLPLRSYQHTSRRRTIGQMVAYGTLFGMSQLVIATGARHGFAHALIVVAIGAAMYGVVLTLFVGWSAKRKMRRWYAGDPRLVAPTPAGAWDLRLRATLTEFRRFRRLMISGDLYVGADLVKFVPLLRTAERHRKPITMVLSQTPHIDVIDRPDDWFTNLLFARPPRYLEIWNGEQCLMFSVPEVDKVAESLRAYWQEVAIIRH